MPLKMAKAICTHRQAYVTNCLSSLKVHSLTNFPHFLHVNTPLILNEYEDDDEMFTPTLGIRATYPILLPTDINSIVDDNIVLKLVEQKHQYLNDVEKVTGNYSRSMKDTKKNKNHIYSMHLNKLMELTVKDPDPYFFGSYNWYYTGGILETASVQDMDLLFHASGKNLNIFNSSIVNTTSNKDRLQLEHLDSTNQIVCDSIFEIFTSNDNCYVAARQKKQFTVFFLQDEISKQDLKCERNIPFTSGTFVNDYFFTIDANRVVQRHDLRQNIESGRMYLKLPKNNSFWCQLKTYNHQLVFADENKIKLYDSRLFGKKASKSMEINMDSIVERCEEITCIQPDANENNLYIATTHNLFVVDIRYGTESTNQLTRYTHQMRTPPYMMDASGGGTTGYAVNERLISLSGTFSDDVMIAQHAKVQHDKVRTNNVPRRMISMNDACRALREDGLHTEANALQNRNRSVNIGTRFIRKDGKLFLLSEKSSGEIFYQQITQDEGQNEPNIDDKPLRNVDLEHEPGSSNKNKSRVTTVTNLRSLKRILTYNLPNESEIPDTENPQPNKWQQSIEQLQSYKDMLSADLLNVWHDKLSIPISHVKTDKTEFVSGWINQASTSSFLADDRSMYQN